MKIAVTGGLGHIGSKLIRDIPLTFPNAEIVIIDCLMTQRYCSLFNLPKNSNYIFENFDINHCNLYEIMSGVDIVIHLAAITDAAGSFDNSDVVEYNNYNSTKLLSDYCLKTNKKFIMVSSTSVYGPQSSIVSESSGSNDLQPQSPYAAVKLKEEDYVSQLVGKGLNAVILRFGTIYGFSPGIRFHTAVNKFCWQASFNKPLTIWETAFQQKRPYLDISDACEAFIHVIKNNLFDGEIYNVVTINATVEEIINSIKKYKPNISINFVNHKIMNQLSYVVDTTKFSSTGYKARGNLDKTIEFELNSIFKGI